MNTRTALWKKAEREFLSNPVVASFDTFSSIVTVGSRIFRKCATGLTEFVRGNPPLAGVFGGSVLLKGGDDFGIGKFALCGAALVTGAPWMYTAHSDIFQELT